MVILHCYITDPRRAKSLTQIQKHCWCIHWQDIQIRYPAYGQYCQFCLSAVCTYLLAEFAEPAREPARSGAEPEPTSWRIKIWADDELTSRWMDGWVLKAWLQLMSYICYSLWYTPPSSPALCTYWSDWPKPNGPFCSISISSECMYTLSFCILPHI